MKTETLAQCCGRLIAALEDLVGQETAALHARDFVAAGAVQERAAPLVEFFASGAGSGIGDADLRARVVALHARRRQSADWLAAEIARTREELNQTQVSQRRVALVAPVYGREGTSRSQLYAVG